MARDQRLTREAIIDRLAGELKPLPYVHAFWESGAAAFNRIDEWSDIDLYALVDEEKVPETFLAVERALTALSTIRLKHVVTWPPASGIHQAFYRLEGASEFLVVDLAVMTPSAPDKFLVREIHGESIFIFNKGAVVTIPPLDAEGFVKKVLERRDRLLERIELFGPFVEKEIRRGNSLEALDYYRMFVLQALVEALRMWHGPLHHDFRMRYVHYELPAAVLRRLEALAFVRDLEDLAAKSAEALAWFRDAIREVDEESVRKRVSGGGDEVDDPARRDEVVVRKPVRD